MPRTHPSDDADRAKIAAATSFNVHRRSGPHAKTNEPAPSLIEAIRIADCIAGEGGKSRPMIYAVTVDGASVFVPLDIVKEARLANPHLPLPASTAAPKPARKPRKAKVAAAPQAPARAAAAAASGDDDVKAPKACAAAGKRAGAVLAAEFGEMPTPPDFTAPTHARFRKKLDAVVALAEAGDIAGLRAFVVNPVSSSPKAIARYRDLAITALEARVSQAEPAG